MIALNEAHNLEAALNNLRGWAGEVFLVDSYSIDETVDIALAHGVQVVQHAFQGFGDQWNFALRELPVSMPWTMKLDPDERLTDTLKREIESAIASGRADAFICPIHLFFMERALPVRLALLRLWRTGSARFSDVSANEHAHVAGRVLTLGADIEHRDSPDLGHWLEKQNDYTTAEAVSAYEGRGLAGEPRLLGNPFERRMWLKRHYKKFPCRYLLIFLYHYVVLGAWRAGWVGYAWSRLRSDVYRLCEYKLRELRMTGRLPLRRVRSRGFPDPRVRQH